MCIPFRRAAGVGLGKATKSLAGVRAPAINKIETLKLAHALAYNLTQLRDEFHVPKEERIPLLKVDLVQKRSNIVAAVKKVVLEKDCWLCGGKGSAKPTIAIPEPVGTIKRTIDYGKNPLCDVKRFNSARDAAVRDPSSQVSFRAFHEALDI